MAGSSGRGVPPRAYPPPGDSPDGVTNGEPRGGDARIDVGVVIVGGGPAGLACANRLLQLLAEDEALSERLGEVPVAVVEKGKACGAHNRSGACMVPEPLRALFPDVDPKEWPFRHGDAVSKETGYWMLSSGVALPLKPPPPPFRNHGNYVVSVAALSRWLGGKGREEGAPIPASHLS